MIRYHVPFEKRYNISKRKEFNRIGRKIVGEPDNHLEGLYHGPGIFTPRC